jgi:hypothetical protein
MMTYCGLLSGNATPKHENAMHQPKWQVAGVSGSIAAKAGLMLNSGGL